MRKAATADKFDAETKHFLHPAFLLGALVFVVGIYLLGIKTINLLH